MIRSAVRLPMPGTAVSRLTSPAASAAISSRGEPPQSTARAIFGPDRLHADQQQEEVALLLGGEAVEGQRVLADDQVREQRDRLARGRHLAQRLGRDRQAVADARGGLDDDVVGAADGDLAGDERDHRAAAITAASGAWLAWQTPTASASVGVVGQRVVGQAEHRADHARHLLLGRAAGAADRLLDLLRRVGRARHAALAGGEHHDAARLADREGAAGVGAEEQVLERDGVGLVRARCSVADLVVDRGQPPLQRDAGAASSMTPPSSATKRMPRRATTP